MKFIKGMIMGTALMAGGMMIYNEISGSAKRKLMKKGRQMAKRMGII